MKNQGVIRSLVLVGLAVIILTTGTVMASAYLELDSVLINFEDDPIKTTEANIWEIEDNHRSMIKCGITITNEGSPIDVFALGFMFYDAFNEHLSTIDGVSMRGIPSTHKATMTWEFYPYKAWMAYTAIVFVSKVRFTNGTIWRQDKHRLAHKIQEITDMLFLEEHLEEERE